MKKVKNITIFLKKASKTYILSKRIKQTISDLQDIIALLGEAEEEYKKSNCETIKSILKGNMSSATELLLKDYEKLIKKLKLKQKLEHIIKIPIKHINKQKLGYIIKIPIKYINKLKKETRMVFIVILCALGYEIKEVNKQSLILKKEG